MENSIFFGLPEVPKISHFCVVKNKRQLFCQRIAIIASNIAWGVICQASRIGFILVLLSILLSIGVFLAMESPGHGSYGIPERPPPFNWNLDPYIVPMFPVGQHPAQPHSNVVAKVGVRGSGTSSLPKGLETALGRCSCHSDPDSLEKRRWKWPIVLGYCRISSTTGWLLDEDLCLDDSDHHCQDIVGMHWDQPSIF